MRAIFEDTAFAHAHWGVVIRSLETGETLYRRNESKVFIPASNQKLLTGAAALEVLGPDFRYRTELVANGPVQNGVLRGDLLVRASGDPTISWRFHEGEARAVFRAWADSLRAHGVRRIAGAVVGVDEVFDDPVYGWGWPWDDLGGQFAAPVAGLQFNEASVVVEVFPASRAGAPGIVALTPPSGHVRLENRTTTVEAGRPAQIEMGYVELDDLLVVSGEIPRDTSGITQRVGVRDPARYFITALRETLREAGIAVEGRAMLREDLEEDAPALRGGARLFVHHSPPVREILPIMMKPSQNQIAEALLKTLGAEARGQGRAAAGAQVVDSLFGAWGLDTGGLSMRDGSGMSRYNFVTPELLIGLLERMTQSPHWELWYASQPVAGIDGTLRNRLRGTPAEGNVHAKTGTLSNIRAVSGYVTTADGERLAFAMLVNHHLRTAAAADRLIDAALVRIAGFSRRN
ncbi:MAG TPA: D-alanyl-D-alanine carboxypeptidase/D-alanyl-D-alanine-endopeptidase [Longimicrobiaceae bacterium]|nr:D-alanyl-D-alanine carboxypeptidase/D-alanyl-D-alanine-endopeptidase [Longimicrobiaceae bacterium]